MKRTIFIFTVSFLIIALAACGGLTKVHAPANTDDVSLNEISKTSANETERFSEIKINNGNTAASENACGVDYKYQKHFIDEVYDIYILSYLFSWDEIIKFTDNIYLKQTTEEMNATPDLYQYIKGLNVSKEEFCKANEVDPRKKYTPEIIELLYCDDMNKMLQGLKSMYAFYWNGKVYSIYEIYRLDREKLMEIAIRSNKFEGYLEMMRKELPCWNPYITEMTAELKAGLCK